MVIIYLTDASLLGYSYKMVTGIRENTCPKNCLPTTWPCKTLMEEEFGLSLTKLPRWATSREDRNMAILLV
jgi:hypothetical protein